MTRRRTVSVLPDRNVMLVKGWRVGELLREGGWRPIYGAAAGAWMLDERHLADVMAYLDHRNIAVEVRGDAHTDLSAADDFDLFGGPE